MKKSKNNDLIEFIKYDWINLIPFGLCLAITIFICVSAFYGAVDYHDNEVYKFESKCYEYYEKHGIVLDSCQEWEDKFVKLKKED